MDKAKGKEVETQSETEKVSKTYRKNTKRNKNETYQVIISNQHPPLFSLTRLTVRKTKQNETQIKGQQSTQRSHYGREKKKKPAHKMSINQLITSDNKKAFSCTVNSWDFTCFASFYLSFGPCCSSSSSSFNKSRVCKSLFVSSSRSVVVCCFATMSRYFF
jgi:hypothetical protein